MYLLGSPTAGPASESSELRVIASSEAARDKGARKKVAVFPGPAAQKKTQSVSLAAILGTMRNRMLCQQGALKLLHVEPREYD